MFPKGFDVFEEREITPIENSSISYFLSPLHIYIYRIICVAISLLMIVCSLLYDPAYWPRFLINWSWLGLCYYFAVSTSCANYRFLPFYLNHILKKPLEIVLGGVGPRVEL